MKQAIKNKYLFAILVAIAIIILTGLIGPKVSSNYVNNWVNKIAEKKDKAHTLAQNIISKQEVELLEFSTKIENDIRDKNPISKIDYLVVGQMLPKAYSISIFESNELVGWNESKILNSDQLIALKNNPDHLFRIRANALRIFAKEFDSGIVYENFKQHILTFKKIENDRN